MAGECVCCLGAFMLNAPSFTLSLIESPPVWLSVCNCPGDLSGHRLHHMRTRSRTLANDDDDDDNDDDDYIGGRLASAHSRTLAHAFARAHAHASVCVPLLWVLLGVWE